MLFGLCELFIYLPDCNSLKEKRNIIKSFKIALRRKYNISISEIGYKNTWRKSIIGVGCIGDSREIIDQTIDKVIKETDNYDRLDLIDIHITNN